MILERLNQELSSSSTDTNQDRIETKTSNPFLQNFSDKDYARLSSTLRIPSDESIKKEFRKIFDQDGALFDDLYSQLSADFETFNYSVEGFVSEKFVSKRGSKVKDLFRSRASMNHQMTASKTASMIKKLMDSKNKL